MLQLLVIWLVNGWLANKGGRSCASRVYVHSILASKAGGSSAERDAYTSFVTQRIRAACMKGVSDIKADSLYNLG